MLIRAAVTHSIQAVPEVVHDVLEAGGHLVGLSLQVPQYSGVQRGHRLNGGLREINNKASHLTRTLQHNIDSSKTCTCMYIHCAICTSFYEVLAAGVMCFHKPLLKIEKCQGPEKDLQGRNYMCCVFSMRA